MNEEDESLEDEQIAELVRESLKLVIDPELGQNVVDLGLIYDITVTDNCIVSVEMTTTTRGCPATGYLKKAVEDRAWAVPGIEFVDVQLTYDPPWSPDMVTPEVNAALGW